MSKPVIVLCSPVRTAIGAYKGSLKDVPAPELGAAVIKEALKRAKLDPEKVESAIMGQVIQAGAKMNPARQAAVKAGVPVTVPAMTVNRVCGSGAQAIASVAQEVMLGLAQCGIAGGMENMDQAPYLMSGGRWGYRMGDAQIFDSMLRDGLNDAFTDQHSGWVTEELVAKFQITREAQDRWACRSQTRFSAAQAGGKFKSEIVAVEVPSHKGTVAFEKDEQNRPDTTLETLAKLKPAFRKDGTITAGNSPGTQQRRSCDGRGRRCVGGKARRRTYGATRLVRHRSRRARHVRFGTRAGRASGPGAGRLEDWRSRTRRNQ